MRNRGHVTSNARTKGAHCRRWSAAFQPCVIAESFAVTAKPSLVVWRRQQLSVDPVRVDGIRGHYDAQDDRRQNDRQEAPAGGRTRKAVARFDQDCAALACIGEDSGPPPAWTWRPSRPRTFSIRRIADVGLGFPANGQSRGTTAQRGCHLTLPLKRPRSEVSLSPERETGLCGRAGSATRRSSAS